MSSNYINPNRPIPAVNISQNDPLNESTNKQVVIHLDSSISITSINSLEDLANLPKELVLDYRLTFKDTNEDLSCLKGIELDPEYNRSNYLLLKKMLKLSESVHYFTSLINNYKKKLILL